MTTNEQKAAGNDVMEYIKDRLCERVGVDFALDAWENKAPENYGVVSMDGHTEEQWADGHLIDAVYGTTITLYVGDGSNRREQQVQLALEEMEEEGMLDFSTFSMTREFLMDSGKVRWTWKVRVYGPLLRDEENEDGEDAD